MSSLTNVQKEGYHKKYEELNLLGLLLALVLPTVENKTV